MHSQQKQQKAALHLSRFKVCMTQVSGICKGSVRFLTNVQKTVKQPKHQVPLITYLEPLLNHNKWNI